MARRNREKAKKESEGEKVIENLTELKEVKPPKEVKPKTHKLTQWRTTGFQPTYIKESFKSEKLCIPMEQQEGVWDGEDTASWEGTGKIVKGWIRVEEKELGKDEVMFSREEIERTILEEKV